MTKNELNALAQKVNAGGEIADIELYKLSDAAGIDYYMTFAGVKQASGELLNKVLKQAHDNNLKDNNLKDNNREELKKSMKSDGDVRVTDNHEYLLKEIRNLGAKAERLTKEINNDLQKNAYAQYDRIASEVMKSRKGGK